MQSLANVLPSIINLKIFSFIGGIELLDFPAE